MSATSERERAQRERARKTWQLVILERPPAELLEAMRKVLRIKRFEIESVATSLPGVVRRGAEVDLAPLQEALSALGVRSELRRSET